MHPDWPWDLRDQCNTYGTPFFFKQWGEWLPVSQSGDGWGNIPLGVKLAYFGAKPIARVGKHRAGRLLDGREWNQVPAVTAEA